MDTYSLIELGIFVLSIINLVIFLKIFRYLIRKQIDKQIKDMIPIKSIRKRIGIKINWGK
tara:strand:- start:237 stop:416 length:180 start_codon:yes stop_codon:yes gene_type:complete